MKRVLAAVAALSVILWSAPALAQATAVTLLLEGNVDPSSYVYTRSGGSGTLDGQTFTACVKFDPSTAPYQTGDGLTYRIETSATKSYVTVALRFSGGLSTSISKTGTATPDLTELYRAYPNGHENEFLLSVHHQVLNPDGTYKGNFQFGWSAFNDAGATSVLFVDPNGGLSYSQPLNLNVEQSGEFNIIELDKKSATTLQLVGTFRLTSVKSVKSC